MEKDLFEDEIMELVKDIKKQVNMFFNRFYEPYGLTSVQALVLIELYKNGDKTIKELSETLDMGKSNLSPLCKRLEAGGFLRRERDEKDQRVVHISLTQYGRETLRDIQSHIESRCIPPLQSCGLQERETIIKGLRLLNSVMKCASETSDGLQGESIK